MQVIFYSPMLPDGVQNPARRHALGQGKVVDSGLALAAGLSPLALDAREQDKPRKTRRVLGDGDGGDAATLEAVMAASDRRVSASHTLIISGGMKARPRS